MAKFRWIFQGRKSKSRAFTLPELMLVLTIIAILATLIFPLLTAAIHKAKLVKTVATIRGAGDAWCVTVGAGYDQIGAGIAQPVLVDPNDFSNILDEIQLLDLEKQLGSLPRLDGWGRPLEYRTDISIPVWPATSPMASRLMIRAKNSNGAWDDPYLWQTSFLFTEHDADPVWVDCTWVQAFN